MKKISFEKVIFVSLIAMVVSFSIIIISKEIYESMNEKDWIVKVNYCDGRPSKKIIHKSFDEPTNRSIRSYKEAVPRFDGEVNVCSIEVLKYKK